MSEPAQGAEQMHELILAWTEEGIVKSTKIQPQQPSKSPGKVRIGRNPSQCDIIITHPTVSGLHIEIYFHQRQESFYLRNLRQSNPPVVDERTMLTEEVPLREGSSIYLGQVELKVVSISGKTAAIPPTVVMLHQPSPKLDVNQPKQAVEIEIDENKVSRMVADIINTDYFQQLQQIAHKARNKHDPEPNNISVIETVPTLIPEANADSIYGSMCPKCRNIAPLKRDLWCIRCGNSMEAAIKVLIAPKNQS